MRINYRDLRRRLELDGAPRTVEHVTEALEEGHLKPEHFSLRNLFCAVVTDGSGAVCGREVLEEFFSPEAPEGKLLTVMEAAGAVDSSTFSAITGQLVFSKILEGFQHEDFVFANLIPNTPTTLEGPEKIPGVSQLGDESEVVDEGKAYPLAGVTQDYVETPRLRKRGFIVPVTKEAVFYDRTNQVLARASNVGYSIGLNKEKRLIDCVIDENVTTYRYRWKGTQIATYGNNSGAHTWDNLQASNGLVDWTDIDSAEQLFDSMTDPYTGEPMLVMPRHVVVTRQNLNVARRIINATEVRTGDGSSTSAQTIHANPVAGAYEIIWSRLLATRLATDTDWFLGDLARAFTYMENWPLTPSQAPTNSYEEFHHDIAYQYKASEKGEPATLEPRMVVKSTA